MKKYRKKIIDKTLFHHLLIIGIWIIILIIIIGSLIFWHLENYNFFDSLYFIIITITTIWYGDIFPITYWWKILAMIYGFMGVPLFVGIMSLIFEKRIKRKVEKNITQIHNELHKTTKQIKETQEQLEKDKKTIKQEKTMLKEEGKKIKQIEQKLQKTNKTIKEIKQKKEKNWIFKNIFSKTKK